MRNDKNEFRFLVSRFVLVGMVVLLVGCAERETSQAVAQNEENKTSTENASHTQIETQLGAVTGLKEEGVVRFLGVPYAAPPVGEARWMPPRLAAPWPGSLDATTYPNRCYATPYTGVLANRDIQGEISEDCLYLNIYTPAADGKKRPVMFWIHGGSFLKGTANEYDGRALARDNDVVVVAINYRLGAFGFLDLSNFGPDYAGSASLGLQDQIAALGWVQSNIADYGGDAANVTIFGESAGASSVLGLLGAPSAKGLFHKAISFSPGEIFGPPQNSMSSLQKRLGAEGSELLAKLRGLSAEEVLALQVEGAARIGLGLAVDGTIVTEPPTQAILKNGVDGIPLIVGNNIDEGTYLVDALPPEVFAFAPVLVGNGDPTAYLALLDELVPSGDLREKGIRLLYDFFRASVLRTGEASAKVGAGGWVYSFELPGDTPYGVTHASDIAFTFDVLGNPDNMEFPEFHESNDFNIDMAKKWSRTFVQFARTGNPNGAGLPEWPQYNPETRSILVVDKNSRIVQDPDGDALRAAYGMK
jgi:para-nitrobenzyl esterase